MHIQKMTIADYDGIYSLWKSCAGMGLNNLDDTKEGIEKFLKRNPETCFVAVTDAKIIGAIMTGTDGRRGYIYHAAVHPDYRKQGVGKMLVNTALSAVKNLGINKVALAVFKKNKEANEFWEKLGFFSRQDIIYRDKPLAEIIRSDT